MPPVPVTFTHPPTHPPTRFEVDMMPLCRLLPRLPSDICMRATLLTPPLLMPRLVSVTGRWSCRSPSIFPLLLLLLLPLLLPLGAGCRPGGTSPLRLALPMLWDGPCSG